MSLSVTSATYLTKLGVSTDPGTFGLTALRPLGAQTNTVKWTFPANLVTHITAGDVVFWLFTLQYSNSSSQRPNSLVVYDVASRQAPVVDAHWTNISTWDRTQFLADPIANTGSGYSHAWPDASGPVVYRLIFNFARSGDPVLPPYGEMTWNVPLVVPPRDIIVRTATGQCNDPNNPSCAQPRIQWTAPDVSWWT